MLTKTSILWLLILSYNVVVPAQTEDMYWSLNLPSFYQGERGAFTCQLQTNDQVPIDNVTGFGLKRTALNESDAVYPQCTIEIVFGQPKKASAASGSRVSDQVCANAYQGLSENGLTTLEFNWDMQDTGRYQCLVFSGSEASVSDAVTRVDQLLVAPTYYQANIPSGVYAGEKVNFHCNSDFGDPPSNWQYAIDGENIRGEPRTTYVASPADNGKLISCYDLSHPNYNGRNRSAYDEYRMEVYYMEPNEVTIENTAFTNATLECDFNRNLPSGTILSYSWAKNGVPVGNETESLEIFVGESDTYECTVQASNRKLRGPTRVTFRVKWLTTSTTTESTTSTTTESTTTTTTKSTTFMTTESTTSMTTEARTFAVTELTASKAAQSTPATTDMAKSSTEVEFRSSTITGPKASKTVESRSSVAVEAKSFATTEKLTEQVWVFIVAGFWIRICI